MSADPENREAKAARWPSSPFQNLRMVFPILVVPLCPARRKVADLVSARASVPGLGDQLDRRQSGILSHRVEEAGMLGILAVDARESRGEIEAKAVDTHSWTQ